MKEKTEMLRYSAIIVDDEAIVREGLVKHFDWKKYSIEIKGCFADGTEAWEFLKNQEIDILITDVKMVRMDGIELTRRAVEKYPNINVLFISGYGDIDYLKNAIKLGAVDYILKSIDLEELAEAMERTTERIRKRKRYEKIIRTPKGKESESGDQEPSVEHNAAIYKVKELIERKYNEQLCVECLADAVNLSTTYLCSLFKAQTGMTLNDYITRIRMEAAMRMLSDTQKHTYEICYDVGYLSPAYFCRLFKTYTGKTPKDWRNENQRL